MVSAFLLVYCKIKGSSAQNYQSVTSKGIKSFGMYQEAKKTHSLMKWLFVKRTEQNSPFHMKHHLGKLLLKASYWAGRASTRTLAIIPNYSALISPCILWSSLYSSNVTREHQVQVTVSGAGMLTQLGGGEGQKFYWSPAIPHTGPREGTSPFPWSTELLMTHSSSQ